MRAGHWQTGHKGQGGRAFGFSDSGGALCLVLYLGPRFQETGWPCAADRESDRQGVTLSISELNYQNIHTWVYMSEDGCEILTTVRGTAVVN